MSFLNSYVSSHRSTSPTEATSRYSETDNCSFLIVTQYPNQEEGPKHILIDYLALEAFNLKIYLTKGTFLLERLLRSSLSDHR